MSRRLQALTAICAILAGTAAAIVESRAQTFEERSFADFIRFRLPAHLACSSEADWVRCAALDGRSGRLSASYDAFRYPHSVPAAEAQNLAAKMAGEIAQGHAERSGAPMDWEETDDGAVAFGGQLDGDGRRMLVWSLFKPRRAAMVTIHFIWEEAPAPVAAAAFQALIETLTEELLSAEVGEPPE